MDINAINIVVQQSKGIPTEFRNVMFEIEKKTFEQTYEICPKTLEELDRRYFQRNLSMVVCKYNEQILGYRIFEKINDAHIQSLFMVIESKYRGLKLANIICSFSAQYFKWLNYKYITSWTHVDITASKILNKYAPYISTNDFLSKKEIELLNSFEQFTKKELGFYGLKRRVPNFYKMLDNRTGDAFFWAHEL